MSNPPVADADKDDEGEKKPSGRVHPIAIDNLIVHKYAGSAALLNKADKIARDIIAGELREGEYFRAVKPGRYHLHFPRLLPEAGQLRATIIGNHIFRAIRDFNPTAIQIRETRESALEPPPLKLGTTGEPDAPARSARPSRQEIDEEEEMKKQASLALKMMAKDVVLREEIVGSELGRLLTSEVEVKQLPVWNVKSGLISAYECVPVRHGDLASGKASLQHLSADPMEIRAIIDMVVYSRVGDMLRRALKDQEKALMLCPVHVPTISNERYVSAFLESGGNIPAAAQKSLVFLIKGFKAPISKLKVTDLARKLRGKARGLIAEMPLDTEDVGLFKELGFHGVRASAAGSKMAERDLLAAVNHFAERCEKAKLESFIGDLRTNSAAVGALASGCTYLSGAAIARRSKRRGTIESFELDALFASAP